MNRNFDQTRDHIRDQILDALNGDSDYDFHEARNTAELRSILLRTFERDLEFFGGPQGRVIVADAIKAASVGVEDDVTPRITEQIRRAAPMGMLEDAVRSDVIEGNRLHLIVLAEADDSPDANHVSVGGELFRNALNALAHQQAVHIDTDSDGVQYIMAGPSPLPPEPPPTTGPPEPQPESSPKRSVWKWVVVTVFVPLILGFVGDLFYDWGVLQRCDIPVISAIGGCQSPSRPSLIAAPPTNTPVRVPTAVPTQWPAQPVAPAPVAVAVAPTDTPTATPRPTSTPRAMPTSTPTPRPILIRERIAFDSERNGNRDIYVMYTDGSSQKRLTHDSAADWSPSWSPAGRRIAFASNRDGNFEIYVMNADGSGQTRLTRNPEWDSHPTWSPDGRRIAFFSYRDGSYRDGNAEIYVMNADGSDQTRLTHNPTESNEDPSWSPDGRHIAFASNRDGNFEIYVMNADGSGQTRLTHNSEFDGAPSWSPDGQRIAFQSLRHGGWYPDFEIYVMNADGSGQTRLTNNSEFDGAANWSPDGRRIVFQSYIDYNLNLYVMNADSSGEVRQLTNNSVEDGGPSWTR